MSSLVTGVHAGQFSVSFPPWDWLSWVSAGEGECTDLDEALRDGDLGALRPERRLLGAIAGVSGTL